MPRIRKRSHFMTRLDTLFCNRAKGWSWRLPPTTRDSVCGWRCVFSSPCLPTRFACLCTPCRSQQGQYREAPYTKAEGKACSISPHLHVGRAPDMPNKLKYRCFVCPPQVWKLKDQCFFCSLSLHVCTCFYTSGDLAGRLQRMNSKLPKTQRSSPWTHNRNAVLQIGSFPCFWLLMTFWPITPSSHTFWVRSWKLQHCNVCTLTLLWPDTEVICMQHHTD